MFSVRNMRHTIRREKWLLVLLLVYFGLTTGCGGSGAGGGGGETGNPVTAAALGVCSTATPVPNTYIVEVQTFSTTEGEIELEVLEVADDCRVRMKGNIKRLLTSALHGFVVVLPEGELPDGFFENELVLRVQQDVVAEADDFIPHGLFVNIPIQQIPNGVRRIFADDPDLAARIDGIDGAGQRVGIGIAILDSGIDISHPDLNVSTLGVDFTASPAGASDVFGHGTHVAGIAAALDNAFGVVGVAPGATLYPVKVLDDAGKGALSHILAGVDWVVANADKIAIANLSLHVSCPSPLLRDALRRAVAAGVVVVASAGNRGVDIFGPDTVYGTADDHAPACFPEVLTVSALADFDGLAGGLANGTTVPDDTLAGYSNFSRSLYPGAPWAPPGMAIDLAAPGYAVLSTFPGGVYETMSGTSMAAPHVTGAAARLIAIRGRDFNLDGVIDAADVSALRQTIVSGSQPQNLWRSGGSTLDPDGNPEPLVDARTR